MIEHTTPGLSNWQGRAMQGQHSVAWEAKGKSGAAWTHGEECAWCSNGVGEGEWCLCCIQPAGPIVQHAVTCESAATGHLEVG